LTRWGAREQCALVVQTGFVVLVGIGEVEVTVLISVVELDRDGVVGLLVHGPDEASQVETEVASVTLPGSAARLEGNVHLWLPCVADLVSCWPFRERSTDGVCWAFAMVVSSLCVACAIIVFDKGCLIFRHGIWSKQVIQVRIVVPRSALRAIRRWPTCIARHFAERIFVEWRRL